MNAIAREFKDFISRGNVVDLAVAVVLGASFNAVVTAFTNGILMNLIAAIFGKPNFDALTFRLGHGVIEYGKFLTAVVNFVIVGFALFLFVKGINAMRRPRPAAPPPPQESDHDLLAQIRDALVTKTPSRIS
ncbi:large conductance mechanosensitive channel protein MscL [Polyangium sp. y55x31]|uniref:large conductance mechanosensitive channel protein MscL n=1 Tax=Polyangium sp. y55x31 TaxID=3042688 RepID=UPI002482877C|nr:large conductance mechanosensitive channel protein MscL [Polyangium sp. y55x31]MDI1477638.1 large conductance mechanosensitive channel protein MscL [Polyangium sp. y55x31]